MSSTKRSFVARSVKELADNDTEDADGDLIGKLLRSSCWAAAIDYRRDGLLSWKHYAAVLLRDVSVQDVAEALTPVLEEMARQVEDAINGQRVNLPDYDDPITIDHWLCVWSEHFRHWTDPVRVMLERLTVTPDAEQFVALTKRSNPIALLDFLLDAITSHESRLSLHQSLCGQRQPLPWIYKLKWDHPMADTSLEALCLSLFDQFAARSSLNAGIVPDTVDIGDWHGDIAREQFDPSTHLR